MNKLLNPLFDKLRDAARDGVTVGRKVIYLAGAKVEVIVKLIIARAK